MDELHAATLVPSLERVIHTVALWLERSLGELQITQAEAHILAHLAHAQRCSINDLHRSFGHRRSTLTSILDRLEQRGLVERVTHPDSRRLVLVELSESGRQIGSQISALLRDFDSQVSTQVGPANLATFLHVLAVIEEHLR